jgi:hypothetical protein
MWCREKGDTIVQHVWEGQRAISQNQEPEITDLSFLKKYINHRQMKELPW